MLDVAILNFNCVWMLRKSVVKLNEGGLTRGLQVIVQNKAIDRSTLIAKTACLVPSGNGGVSWSRLMNADWEDGEIKSCVGGDGVACSCIQRDVGFRPTRQWWTVARWGDNGRRKGEQEVAKVNRKNVLRWRIVP